MFIVLHGTLPPNIIRTPKSKRRGVVAGASFLSVFHSGCYQHSCRLGRDGELDFTINGLDQIPDVYRSSRDIATQYHSHIKE